MRLENWAHRPCISSYMYMCCKDTDIRITEHSIQGSENFGHGSDVPNPLHQAQKTVAEIQDIFIAPSFSKPHPLHLHLSVSVSAAVACKSVWGGVSIILQLSA